MMKDMRIVTVMAALMLLVLASAAVSGPGDLVWFGYDTSCDFYAYTNSVAVQPDGCAVLVGKTAGGGWTIARFTATGALDLSFGNSGKVELFSGYVPNQAYDVAIDGSSRIIVVGRQGEPARFTVVRLLGNGALDTNFGNGGIVVTAFNANKEDIAKAVVVQPDGKIVAAGTTKDNKSYKAYALTRYNTDGTLDTASFGPKVKKNKPDRYGYIIDDPTNRMDDSIFQGTIALQSTGKILLGGFVNRSMNSLDIQGWTVSRYNTDGSLDTTFGSNGRNTLESIGSLEPLHLKGLGVQSDDRIVAGGRGWDTSIPQVYGIAVRYTSDGVVDTSFGISSGLAMTTSATDATNVVIQVDDKVVIGTGSSSGGIGLFRWTASGLADGSFGNGGQSILAGVGFSAFVIGCGPESGRALGNLRDRRLGDERGQISVTIVKRIRLAPVGEGVQLPRPRWPDDPQPNAGHGSHRSHVYRERTGIPGQTEVFRTTGWRTRRTR